MEILLDCIKMKTSYPVKSFKQITKKHLKNAFYDVSAVPEPLEYPIKVFNLLLDILLIHLQTHGCFRH